MRSISGPKICPNFQFTTWETRISRETFFKKWVPAAKCLPEMKAKASITKSNHFRSQFRSQNRFKNYQFLGVCFFKIAILHETSFENRHLRDTTFFCGLLQKLIKIELSPARQARNDIFTFCKKAQLYVSGKVKIEVSPARELDFDDVQSPSTNEGKKSRFLDFCILQ